MVRGRSGVALESSAIVRRGVIGGPDVEIGWPVVATDVLGNLFVTYNRASFTFDEFLSAWIASIPPGSTEPSEQMLVAGDDLYNARPGPERWGDFNAIGRDPTQGTVCSPSTNTRRRTTCSSRASTPFERPDPPERERARAGRYPFRPMRLSAFFAPTLREDPAEAEVPSHRLLLRAGFVRPVAAGVYDAATRTPLDAQDRAHRPREMEASGAIELRMPILLPADPWKATRRYELYGETLFRLTDRHERDMLLGPHRKRSSPRSSPPSCRRTEIFRSTCTRWNGSTATSSDLGSASSQPRVPMKDAYTFDRDEEGMRPPTTRCCGHITASSTDARCRTSSSRPSRDRSAVT